MDTSFDSLKQNAYTSGSEAAKIGQDAPGMLQTLKQNLVGIFAKDNPVISARDTALSDYLATPNNTRAALLPSNLPMVEGSNLNLSPTQQDAIVGARSAAALAPLAGLNEILKAQYGNIGDMISGAGSIYDSILKAAQYKSSNALDLYKAAIAEEEAKKNAAGSAGLDLPAIMAMIQQSLGIGGKNGANGTPKSSGFFDDIPAGSDPLANIDTSKVPQLNLNSPTNSPSAGFAPAPAKPTISTTPPFKIGGNTTKPLFPQLKISL